MKKENPKSMFQSMESEEKDKRESEVPMETEKLANEHPQMDATGEPVHPKLQELMSKLSEPEEESLMPHKIVGIKKK